MISRKFLLLAFFTIHTHLLANSIDEYLDPYKNFLEVGTYENQDWSNYKIKPKSRYHSFKYAFEHFATHQGKTVVELGTSRSFVHGGHPGCNLSDPHYWTPENPEDWDWGAGFFTRMACECLIQCGAKIHTVDINPEHIKRCKVITMEFKDRMFYHVSSSQDFLRTCNFPDGIDLLYLDTGDMTPIEPTALLQLEEVQIIVERNLLSKDGIILVDDVRNQTPKKFGEKSDLGKSKYALPYLLGHGFEIVIDEYQVILKKKN